MYWLARLVVGLRARVRDARLRARLNRSRHRSLILYQSGAGLQAYSDISEAFRGTVNRNAKSSRRRIRRESGSQPLQRPGTPANRGALSRRKVSRYRDRRRCRCRRQGVRICLAFQGPALAEDATRVCGAWQRERRHRRAASQYDRSGGSNDVRRHGVDQRVRWCRTSDKSLWSGTGWRRRRFGLISFARCRPLVGSGIDRPDRTADEGSHAADFSAARDKRHLVHDHQYRWRRQGLHPAAGARIHCRGSQSSDYRRCGNTYRSRRNRWPGAHARADRPMPPRVWSLRILDGENASQIPATIQADAVKPVFDWAQLQRWRVSEAQLPPGSEIRFRQPTFWEQYFWQIMAQSCWP